MIIAAFLVFNDLSNHQDFPADQSGAQFRWQDHYRLHEAVFSENAFASYGNGHRLLLVTALLMILTIERAFNEIWRVKEPRPLFRRVVMYGRR